MTSDQFFELAEQAFLDVYGVRSRSLTRQGWVLRFGELVEMNSCRAEEGYQTHNSVAKPDCNWFNDQTAWENDGGWDTTCGNRFYLCEGSPSENDMKFCCYCGGQLVEERQSL